MANTPAIGLILSQLLQQSGGAPPSSAPPMGTPAPSLGVPSPQPSAPPMASPEAPSSSPMASILSQAMQRLNTTSFQPTPTGGGPIDPSAHPVLAQVVQALARGAGAYGWAGMPPGERTERTQLEQQKAETMARLAQAGVAQEQTAAYREQMASTAAERARAYSENVESQKKARETQAQIAQQRADTQQEMVRVRRDIGEGRLQVAHDTLTMRASQFEQTFKLRAQQVGIEQAKLELLEQGNMIKQGFLDVARGALSQRGTVEGAQLTQKLQTLQLEHPILSQIIGLDDVAGMVSESRGAQIPGVSPTTTPLAPAATAPLPGAPTPQKPRATAARPAAKPTGGITHTFIPGKGIQPVGTTPP